MVGELRRVREWPTGRDEYVLEFGERGAISKLRFGKREVSKLAEMGEGEVEVEVEASALNFRDVLNVLGMYPGEAGLMGLEFAGRVRASKVAGMEVGSEVMGLGSNCFARSTRGQGELVVKKPEGVTMAEAASAPVVFCTAMAVMEEAELAGKTVLVHAAAGGVGAAASQVALRMMGAKRVFGTAGSESKRGYARRWGAEPVVGSRDTRYSEEILEATGGAGADYVLNSLTGGEFVERTMACTSEEVHWSEIGKRGIATMEEFAEAKPRGRYHVYDLGDDMREVPAKVGRLLGKVAEGLRAGVLRGVCERVYPLRKAKEAYQYMFEGRHVGKIVFEHPKSESEWRKEELVVMSGAYGGLGQVYSSSISSKDKGKAMVLVGRRGAGVEEEAMLRGAESVQVCGVCDVSEAESTRAVVAAGRAASGSKGKAVVLHMAGVLRDGLLKDQSWAAFEAVVRPKVAGLRSLVEAAGAGAELVLFSSVTALVGNVGQANYGAANGFLDGFAEGRAGVVSVNWGAWEVGMYAQLDERLKSMGRGLDGSQAGELLEKARAGAGESSGGTSVGMIRVDWSESGVAKTELVKGLVEAAKRSKVAKTTKATKSSSSSNSSKRSREEVESAVNRLTRDVLGMGHEEKVDESAALQELGFDSMMSVELRRRIAEELEVELPATLLFDYPTVAKMRERVVELSVGSEDGESVETAGARRDGKGRLKTTTTTMMMAAAGQSDTKAGAEVAGAACRFGKAWTVDELWRALAGGHDAIREAPRNRWKWETTEEVSYCGMFDGIALFDAGFFQYFS